MNFPSKPDCVVPLVWFKSKIHNLNQDCNHRFWQKVAQFKLEMREYRRERIVKEQGKEIKMLRGE